MAFSSPINDEISFTDPDVNGRVIFTFQTGELELQFTWEAFANLQSRWDSKNEFDRRAREAIDTANMEDLAVVAAVASGRTPDEIMAMSPPINPLCDALVLAWSYAWNGGQPPEEKPEEEPEKTTARLTLFGWRLRAPFVRA